MMHIRRVVLAAIATAGLVGVASCGGGSQLDELRAALEEDNVTRQMGIEELTDEDLEELLATIEGVCEQLDDGTDLDTIHSNRRAVATASQMSMMSGIEAMEAAAVPVVCPEHADAVE